MLLGRLVFTLVVMAAVVALLRTGAPLGGLVVVPLLAIWLRRRAEARFAHP